MYSTFLIGTWPPLWEFLRRSLYGTYLDGWHAELCRYGLWILGRVGAENTHPKNPISRTQSTENANESGESERAPVQRARTKGGKPPVVVGGAVTHIGLQSISWVLRGRLCHCGVSRLFSDHR